jgi:hypothetical protein
VKLAVWNSSGLVRNKEASVLLDNNAQETIKVYTDGLAHDGRVDTTAILTRWGKADRTLRVHMGTMEEHTVPKVELVGLMAYTLFTQRSTTIKATQSVWIVKQQYWPWNQN